MKKSDLDFKPVLHIYLVKYPKYIVKSPLNQPYQAEGDQIHPPPTEEKQYKHRVKCNFF